MSRSIIEHRSVQEEGQRVEKRNSKNRKGRGNNDKNMLRHTESATSHIMTNE